MSIGGKRFMSTPFRFFPQRVVSYTYAIQRSGVIRSKRGWETFAGKECKSFINDHY